MQRELRIGQPRAQRIQPLLADNLADAIAEAATDMTNAKEA
ncbi:hypothetical protein ACFQ3Z_16170 [Streptomyces nogalater]